ncbi:MAG: dockerin type I repeat-containing protein, partial [Bacteroidaceae bacterium]|nr:dockerin type I repeat-containing protein [Bacteroidaceae bacterium]
MKKIYSLIALIAMFVAAVSVSAQKYHLVQKADAPVMGTTYALYNASSVPQPFANATNGTGISLLDDTYLWQFEATGEKSDDGYDLYVLKNVGKDGYWQECPFEENFFADSGNPYDGYDYFSYAGINAEFGDKATACRFTLMQAGSEDSWRAQVREGDSADGFVLARNKTVEGREGTSSSAAGTTFQYKLGYQGENLAFEPWNEYVSWQLWTVELNGPKDKLQELVDLIAEADITYLKGDDPGMYNAALVDAFNEAYEAGVEALVEPGTTDDQFNELYETLLAAREALNGDSAINPVKEGYYFIVSGYSAFFDQQGVEKGVYVKDVSSPVRWMDFNQETVYDNKGYEFLWHLTKYGDGDDTHWRLTNAKFGYDYNGPNEDGYSKKCYVVESSTRPITFKSLGQSQWLIANTYNTHGMHTESHSGGGGKSGDIVTWDTGADNGSAWYLRTVTDQEFIEAAESYAAQQALVAELAPLASKATTLYDKLFEVAPNFSAPLITEADDTKAPGEEGCQFFSNCKESVEGRYAALIDGIVSATWKQNDDGDWYDSGTATNFGPDHLHAFFHSHYSGYAWPDAHQDKTPYLAVDISKTPVSEFVLRTARRFNAGTTDTTRTDVLSQPIQIAIYASNDTTGYTVGTDQWEKITTINPYGVAGGKYYVSNIIQLGKAYKYLRFDMEEMTGGTAYFTYAEFNLYPATISEEVSQYYYIDGMKDAADALKAEITAARKAIDDGTVTEQTIADLQAAMDAVQALYVDANGMLADIAQAEKEIAGALVGDNFGNIKSDATVAAYQTAVDVAKRIDVSGALDKTAIDAAIQGLKEARKAMLDDMVVPEPGKWYYIVNANDEDSYSEEGTMYAGVANNTANVNWLQNLDGTLDDNGTAMWQFIPVEGDTPNVFYIQNMGTGLYMGNESANAYSKTTTMSNEPIPFEVAINLDNGNTVYIISQKDNSARVGLHCAAAGKAIVGWYANSTAHASYWTFREVDSDIEGVVIPVIAGGTRVQTLPFPVEGLSEFNDGIQFYAVRNMTKEGDVTTVELYEKDSFEAGEPFVVVVDEETNDLLVPAPTTDVIVDKPGTANGLVGALNITPIPVGKAYFANTPASEEADASVELRVIEEAVSIAPLKGYVDPAFFTGEVEGETALTFEAVGLDWAASGTEPADVNGDGNKNTADVVAVYTFIEKGSESGFTREAADVNRDGSVNTADVVAIYTAIIGGSGSKGFAKAGAFYPGAETIDGSDNVLTILVESTDDLSKIPVTLYLTNPTNEITAVEATLVAPVDVKKFLYDDEEDDFVYDAGDRWAK